MTEKGLKLIMDFEGLPKNKPLDAYWDKYGKVWTIGYGATHYLDGSPVKEGDNREVAGGQPFVKDAALNIVIVTIDI